MSPDRLHSDADAAEPPGDRSVGAASSDVVTEMAGLVDRLLRDPDSDAVVIPQLMRLSEGSGSGAARGAVESSVAAMSQLRGWLQHLQARQRMHTRFADISARLSRIDGVQPLMDALADEARRLVDAPLARLDATVRPGLQGSEQNFHAGSGEFLSALQQIPAHGPGGWSALLGHPPAPLHWSSVLAELRPAPALSDLTEALRMEGVHGLIVVPMIQDSRHTGSLMVADRVMRRWSPLDIEALQHLATVSLRAITRAARAEMALSALRGFNESGSAARWPAVSAEGGIAKVPQAAPDTRATPSGTAPNRLLPGASASASGHPLLQGIPPGVRESFMRETIGALIKADLTRGTALCRTLLTYIENGHNARAAARLLGVHVNTLHNRLESIGGLVPGWQEPARALSLHLALALALPGDAPAPAVAGDAAVGL